MLWNPVSLPFCPEIKENCSGPHVQIQGHTTVACRRGASAAAGGASGVGRQPGLGGKGRRAVLPGWPGAGCVACAGWMGCPTDSIIHPLLSLSSASHYIIISHQITSYRVTSFIATLRHVHISPRVRPHICRPSSKCCRQFHRSSFPPE